MVIMSSLVGPVQLRTNDRTKTFSQKVITLKSSNSLTDKISKMNETLAFLSYFLDAIASLQVTNMCHSQNTGWLMLFEFCENYVCHSQWTGWLMLFEICENYVCHSHYTGWLMLFEFCKNYVCHSQWTGWLMLFEFFKNFGCHLSYTGWLMLFKICENSGKGVTKGTE